ncbi:MAG: helix-turn-helix domain-containing protein [Planctomycetes bacterium]|jgi:AraC-like DNA-binding protein|nr:helix-turn-helix domain-containing protein [Planctomycetota bacterium]
MPEDMQFLFKADIQTAFDHFYSLLGVRIAFFTSSGGQLKVGKRKGSCAYCRLLRSELGHGVCLAQDDAMRRRAAAEGKMICYQCHAGLTEAIAPIYVDGMQAGFIMIGQFRRRNRPSGLHRFRPAVARKLRRAFEAVPYFTQSRCRDVLAFLEIIVRHVASNRLVDIRRPDMIQPILDHIHQHPDGRLSLRDAAAMIHRSPSSVTHAFKKHVGTSFRRYQIQARLNKATHLLQTTPDATVSLVAAKLGFDDPLYFSRLYKKYKGCCPSKLLGRSKADVAGGAT